MSKPTGYRCPGSGVGHPHGKDQKKQRRDDAQARVEEQGVLTLSQKLTKALHRPGKSQKEVDRLIARSKKAEKK